MSEVVIEMLYPEIANLHGDNANITYLAQCLEQVKVIRTGLSDRPAFVDQQVNLVYLGPMTESGQQTVVERLHPYRDQIIERIETGGAFLFTHNAMEILGTRIRNDAMGYDIAALGVFEFETELRMFARYNGKVMGELPELGPEHPILGYKSQFSMIHADASLPGFLTAQRGIGRNLHTAVEGLRRANVIGTSLLGPLLIVNPHFTRSLLTLIAPNWQPKLAHETFILAAYESRLAEFQEARRWHRYERVVGRCRSGRGR